jgi:hypothetical protein
VNELAEMLGVPVLLDELPPLGVPPPDELLEHAEATSPAPSSATAKARLLLVMKGSS